LLQVSLQALFSPQILLILAFICVVLLLITGFLPAYLFSKVPVTAAFQKARETHRKWKLVLIFIEVAASSFIIALLLMIGLQYKKLINENQGYSYENLLYVNNYIEEPETRNIIIQELIKFSEVKNVSLCSELPCDGASGNNISEIGSETELFNIADLYEVDENFLSVLEIPVIEGKGFIKGETGENMMMVSESFVDRMAELAGWKDGVVDKSVWVSEHGEQTICGVFGNILLSSDGFGSDTRPAVIFYEPEEAAIFLIKLHKITPEAIEKISAIFRQFAPDQIIEIRNYEENFRKNFNTIKVMRSGMLICSIVTFLIALIGLIGYIHNETNRRRSEIAIRKIHGATVNSIQSLFLKNILIPVIPAIVVGIVAAVVVTKFIQKYFIDKTHISLLVYILCAVCIVSVVLAVVSINILRASMRNPVENLE
jgi:putative ABC transport system permease protein